MRVGRKSAAVLSATVVVAAVLVGGGTAGAATANTVAISSDHGHGTARTTGYGRLRGLVHGDLTSRRGDRVYISGKIVYDGNTDNVCGRMTGNVTATAGRVVDGSCDGDGRLVGTPSGMEFRVCKDRAGLDSCGPWSAKSRF
ncbi:hypothetical protein AB0I60_02865 [Actinosynnema sp. NPDC050436]|uniref:hypothetical protein n=1 Tax=Actinosynnema sp. NPDC050436 TaxID=3155659 RepID=UPI00340542D5